MRARLPNRRENRSAKLVWTDPATGRDVPLRHDPRRAGDIARSLGDPALAREVLRFTAETRLDDGMADLARHLAAHGRRASSG